MLFCDGYANQEEKAESDYGIGPPREGYRLSGGSSYLAHQKNRGIGLTFEKTPKRQALPKGTFGHGSKQAKAFEIFAKEKFQTL